MHTCDLGQSSHQIVRFWPNFGVGLALYCVFEWKTCTIPIPGFINLAHEPFLTLECFCSNFNHLHMAFGPNQPWSCSFWPKLGVSLAENLVVDLKFHVRFPSQSSWSLLVNQFWLWNASAAVCNHVYVLFGPELPQNWSFLAKFGHQVGRKSCVWMKKHVRFPSQAL